MANTPQSKTYTNVRVRTNQTGSTTFSDQPTVVAWVDYLSGASNPGWKKSLASGKAVVGNYYAEKRTVSLGQSYMQSFYKDKSNPSVFSNWTFQGLPSAPSFHSGGSTSAQKAEAENQASAEFYSSVQKVYAEFQALVAAGEAKQTLNLVVGNLQDLLTLSKHTKKEMLALIKNGSRRKDLMRRLRSRYLEWTFGVMPLLSDIESLMAAAESDQGPTQIATGVGKFKTSSTATAAVTGFSNSQCPLTYNLRTGYTYSVKYTAKLDLGLPVKSKFTPPRGFGTNLREFVPSAYNLLPWSFVVDYVSNLGSCIVAEAYANVGQVYAYKNIKTTNEREASWSPRLTASVDSMSGGFSYETKHESTSRGEVAVVPLPHLTFRSPSAKQVLNMIALFSKPF